jgi:hypothetical protein
MQPAANERLVGSARFSLPVCFKLSHGLYPKIINNLKLIMLPTARLKRLEV